MAQISSRKCDICETETGKLYCYECRHFLCHVCKKLHDKFQKKHTVTDSHNVDRLALSQQLICEEHKEDFVHFCPSCDCLICSSCVTSSHQGHSFTQVSEVVSQARENVISNIDGLKRKIKTATNLIEPIKTTKFQKIKTESEQFSSEVETTSKHITSIVNSVTDIEMTRASDFLVLEKQQLEFTIAKLEKMYKEHTSVSSQLEQVLELKHDIAFFLNQKSITRHIGDLDDIPRTIEEPNEIGKFNKEDFAKAVVKHIQSQYNLGSDVAGTKIQNIYQCTTQQQEQIDDRENHGSNHKRSFLVCAAIDIGSTHSGYAFSSFDDYQTEPTKIFKNVWTGSKLLSYKTPTALLLDNDREFLAFGFEAVNKYTEFVAEEEQEDYYYFDNFKMSLYDRRITRDLTIKDYTGYKEMDALTVFQYSIHYLKDHLYNTISNKILGIQEQEIHYVLTVPAILDEPFKILKEAAVKAGIRHGQLSIITESEAAISYCHQLEGRNLLKLREGMKYMVIDLGGRRAEITCHQRYIDGSFKEIVPASGGPWGGESIDQAFAAFLKRICGPRVIDELHDSELEDYIDLFREFETKKRSIRVNQTNKVVVTLPVALLDLVKKHRGKMETAIEQSPYGMNVSYSKQKLDISPDTFRNFFKRTEDALIKHLDRMFRDDKLADLETIVVVGGFAECELIQHRLKEKFGKSKNIIFPEEAGLAVLNGAVLFGHRRKTCNLAYGIRYWHRWDPQLHPPEKRQKIGENHLCGDFFLKFVRRGQRVEQGHTTSFVLKVLNAEDKIFRIGIFSSSEQEPRYVTDPGCQKIGDLIIPLGERDKIDEVEVSMIFYDKELLVKGKDCISGRVAETKFDITL